MLGLPDSTKIRKIIPKKTIYEQFSKDISRKRKNSFNDEIAKIVIINELSPYSLNIEIGENVQNIFVINIDLKEKRVKDANISLLSKVFGQKILYLISYKEEGKLAIFQDRLFQTEYKKLEDLNVNIEGLNLDTIWENLVLNISGYSIEKNNDLKEQIQLEEKREKLRTQIDMLEKQARGASQPRRSFEIYQQTLELKKELEEL